MKDLEMPVPCDKCGEWIELNSTRESELEKGKMLCRECYSTDDLVNEKIDEIKDIQYMLDNNDLEAKGNKRELKRRIKDLKAEITELGYDFEHYNH